MLCKSMMKLLPPVARIKSATTLVDGTNITHCRERNMRKLRRKLFSMVFQNPMTSLNLTMTIGSQITLILFPNNVHMTFSSLNLDFP